MKPLQFSNNLLGFVIRSTLDQAANSNCHNDNLIAIVANIIYVSFEIWGSFETWGSFVSWVSLQIWSSFKIWCSFKIWASQKIWGSFVI